MDSRHVVIVADCDHQSIDIERAVLAEMSPDLPWLNCRTEDEIIAQCSSAEGLIIMYAPMTRRVLEQLEHCKIIARYGVGVDTIDLKAAADLGIIVSNVPDYGTHEVSDHALAMMLCLTRKISYANSLDKSGKWDFRLMHPVHRHQVQTMGILGIGRIGGAMAHQLFKAKVHVGYLAALVAASNAGGSGSVVGGTTTTMMWIDGISPITVLDAYIASVVALCITAYFGAKQQHAYSPIIKHVHKHTHVDKGRLGIVLMILVFAIVTNIVINVKFNQLADHFPFIGVAVWLAILLSIPVRRPDWEVLPETAKGTVFLLSLVSCASMMPVEQLPPASALAALSLGFVSAVFDNIPLTALALKQGGYDWGVLAYAVGFGGSMIWFGSSAGVALSNMYPEAKSVANWIRHGWHVALAYVVGFAVLYATLGWHPEMTHKTDGNTQVETHAPANK